LKEKIDIKQILENESEHGFEALELLSKREVARKYLHCREDAVDFLIDTGQLKAINFTTPDNKKAVNIKIPKLWLLDFYKKMQYEPSIG
jgi:hypothetical protein